MLTIYYLISIIFQKLSQKLSCHIYKIINTLKTANSPLVNIVIFALKRNYTFEVSKFNSYYDGK